MRADRLRRRPDEPAGRIQLELDQIEDAQTAAGARAQLKESLRLYSRRVMGRP